VDPDFAISRRDRPLAEDTRAHEAGKEAIVSHGVGAAAEVALPFAGPLLKGSGET